ncbi:MAG TPA: FAD-dependent monooxygenase [Rhizomicrobium sp.]|jgi:2-octaprenyl-6-methoxyphenol hydroxylase|nr:FAD-dependent monooxygenase [Rhizomicrobium sp.]
MSQEKHTDIVIGGGGMVGLALALALARGGLNVVVADPLPQAKTTEPAFDGRVSALSYSSARMLEALGVWEHLKPRTQPINDILVTDAKLGRAPSPFSLHFDHREIGVPMGYIAENRDIRAALHACAEGTQSLATECPASVVASRSTSRAIEVVLDSGQSFHAPLFVAAEGRESPSRERMGIGLVAWSYRQRGIVATVAHERPHHGTAWEHFLPSGPFAILPMTGNRSSLVWTEREALADAMLRLPDPEFQAEIARRFGAHLGAVHSEAPRWSYPLRFHLARAWVRPRFALAGDAAHGIHPIAGQGLNLGFKDVAALAEVVLDAARLGLDFGAPDVLGRYERWRRFDSFALAAATDALNRLFSTDIAPLRVVRDLGLGIVDGIGPLRRFFMRHAGGEIGKLPRLLRGEAA